MNQPDPAARCPSFTPSAASPRPASTCRSDGSSGWSWESYWLVGGVFSWIVAPWAVRPGPDAGPVRVLADAPAASLAWTYVFGVLWGIGGLTFGLTMRYLGIALGMAMALGYCAAFGTLMPPLFRGELGRDRAAHRAARSSCSACSSAWLGIVVSGLAGRSKERELTAEQKHGRHPRIQLRQGSSRRHDLRHPERLHVVRLRGR